MGLQKELEAKNLDGVIRELTENPSCIDDVTEKGVPLALYAAEPVSYTHLTLPTKA